MLQFSFFSFKNYNYLGVIKLCVKGERHRFFSTLAFNQKIIKISRNKKKKKKKKVASNNSKQPIGKQINAPDLREHISNTPGVNMFID